MNTRMLNSLMLTVCPVLMILIWMLLEPLILGDIESGLEGRAQADYQARKALDGSDVAQAGDELMAEAPAIVRWGGVDVPADQCGRRDIERRLLQHRS